MPVSWCWHVLCSEAGSVSVGKRTNWIQPLLQEVLAAAIPKNCCESDAYRREIGWKQTGSSSSIFPGASQRPLVAEHIRGQLTKQK